MDILKKFNKEKTSPNKKVKFYCVNNVKKQMNNIEDIQLKKISSYKGKKDNAIKKGKEKDKLLPISPDHLKMSKYGIEQGKYFMKKILQMKKEINKNEFSNYSEGEEDIKKNKNNIMEKIGTDLKQSLLNLREESGYKLSPRKNIKMEKSKTKHNDSNIVKSNANSPKNKNIKNTSILNTNFNLNNIVKSNDDLTHEQLLNNKNNNSKLELLSEEIKNSNIKNTNKSDGNKNIISKKSNKSNKSNGVISKRSSNEKYRKLINRGLVYDSFDDEEEFEEQINKEFFIMPNSIFIYILDTLVALNIFYFLTYNPYYIASSTTFLFSNILNLREIYHFFMEFVFFIDFLIQFIKAYYDFDENLVTSKKRIILHYLSSWFFIDLITVIPTFTIIKLYYEKEKYHSGYDYICRYGCQSDNLIHLACFIKIIKVSKILNRNENQFVSFIISRLSNTSFMDNWGTMVFEVILTILALHITACIHIIIGRNSYPNWIILNNLSESNFSTIYLTSIYFLVTTLTSVGYGDITGNVLNEYIFQIFLLIVGIIAYSWMVSSVSNYVIENNKDNIFFSSKVGILDEIKLVHPEMDKELYNKIYLYLKQLKLQHKRKDKNILLENLPYNLRNELLYEINKPLIEGLNFFRNFHNSVFILSAVTKLIPIVTVKGDIIIEQNEIINSMIFVKQGRLGVEIAVDMNNIYNELDNYLNGTFILEKEDNKEKEKEKLIALQYKRKNAFSLMSTFNYTMDDSFIFGEQRKLDLNYKRPVSFRKKLLKFMEKKFGSNAKGSKAIKQKKIKYIKLYYIRKGEQFGEIFMFLNKPSSFTVRVKSPKAELLLLKKIDAIEISSNYPNIWKRANKKSFNNFIHLKELVAREVAKFCEKNGIKYNRTFRLEDIQRFKSLPNLEKSKKKDKKNNISEKIKKFQLHNRSLIEKNKNNINNNPININNIDINLNKTSDINKPNIKVLDTKKLIDDDNKSNKNSIISENNGNNNIIRQLTPYNEDEINNEIYNGELFTENISKNTNSIDKANYDNESNYYNLFKNDENNSNSYGNKKHKNLIKLIDSSRGKKNLKLHYHKNKKSIFKNNNYNVQYNINNSFNINQMQKNSIFLTNQLSISNPISFKINNIYENLNIISQGHYKKDFIFQKKIKIIFQNKYNKENNNNNNVINSVNNTNINSINSAKNMHNSLKNKLIRKATRVSSFISPKHTFFKNSKIISIIKESEIKGNQFRSQRRKTLENVKTINKEDKSKKAEKDESSVMINRITKNIIDGDKNLNNPEIFYNELFANIISNKNNDLTSTMLMKNLQLKKTIRKGESKKSTTKKRTFKNNLSISPNTTIK